MFTDIKYNDNKSRNIPGTEYLSLSLTNLIENMNVRVEKNKLMKATNVVY